MSRHAAGRWASAPREPGRAPVPVRPGARARHSASRQGSWVLAVAVVALAGFAVTLLPWTQEADAAGEDGLVTTASTRTVAWADTSHVGTDGTGPVFAALKDWELRVSQTANLLNQTVQVSWTGATDGGVLQLMQCWSDGPAVRPTREQCAYGGNLLNDSQGSSRSRSLGTDSRERTYFRAPELSLVALEGKVPALGAVLTQDSELTLGGNATQTCPEGTTAHAVFLTPPRDAVAARKIAPRVEIEPSTAGVPAALTLVREGADLVHAVATKPFSLKAVAAANALTSYPLGRYRFDLSCTGAGGVTLTSFVVYFDHVESGTRTVWRKAGIGGISVPFDPLGSGVDDAPTDPFLATDVLEYLKPRTTNEVGDGRSRPDRAGALFMEVFTDLEAQHLGCGRVEATVPRSCWLVAVPRWAPEPDGSTYNPVGAVSPLSQSLWDRRLEVPLSFSPVDSGCTVGSGLKQVLSHDSALAVLRSWQPTFCENAATASSVLGPIQDSDIRSGLSAPNRMGVVTVPPAVGKTLVKAPIATSAVVVGFVADRRSIAGTAAENALDQTRVTSMRLTPRLVAKLLTQSYDSGAAPNGGKTSGYNSPPTFTGSAEPTYTPPRNFPANNPRTLYDDPEFLSINPSFEWLKGGRGLVPLTQMGDVLVSANDTDAYQVLWRWLLSDARTKAFLDGAPDEGGMRINPYYKGRITSSTSSFPAFDPTCSDTIEDPIADAFSQLCQPNMHPRVENDTQAAQAAVRGDTKRVNVTPAQLTGNPNELVFTAEPRQDSGRQGMLVITTSAAAARFGLPTAQLQNSSKAFVGPTPAAMALARNRAVPRADGVALTDPGKVTGGGYPLTTTSYAVVDVAETTKAQNSAFATILDYAAGKGQVPGTAAGELPPGYAPLSEAQSAQASAGAALLRNPASLLAATVTPAASPAPAAAPTRSGSGGSGTSSGSGTDFPPATTAPTASTSDPAGTPAPAAPAPPDEVLVGEQQLTRGTPSPVPMLLPSVLLLGLVAAVAGRALPLLRRPAS